MIYNKPPPPFLMFRLFGLGLLPCFAIARGKSGFFSAKNKNIQIARDHSRLSESSPGSITVSITYKRQITNGNQCTNFRKSYDIMRLGEIFLVILWETLGNHLEIRMLCWNLLLIIYPTLIMYNNTRASIS